jgi:LysR family transcriptional regulator for bpeEF and oprC
MDRFRAMDTFVRVAELGSFTRAADLLEVNKATVTTHVAQLESHLGVRLLERTTRRLALTADGAAFLEHAKRILGELADAEAELGRSRTVARGRLRAEMTAATARIVVLPRLPRLLAAHPELEVVISMHDETVDLVESGIDVALRVGPLADTSYVARKLHDLRWVTCASPAYLARRGEPLVPADLATHDCLGLYSLRDRRAFDWAFHVDGAETFVTPRGPLALTNPESLVDAAIGGIGIVQIVDVLAAEAIAAGRLRPVLAAFDRADRTPVSIVYPQRRHLSAKVRAFVDFAATAFEELAALRAAAVPSPATAPAAPARTRASRKPSRRTHPKAC